MKNNMSIFYYNKENKLVIDFEFNQIYINDITSIEFVGYDLLYFNNNNYVGMISNTNFCKIIIK